MDAKPGGCAGREVSQLLGQKGGVLLVPVSPGMYVCMYVFMYVYLLKYKYKVYP